ncbi:MAG: oxidoreductase [Actinobacteria bacterium RBG_16_68_21]|nr:MAG: oxidoreductase [Actinobacteria bacterium RBG_16_68_21]
MTSFFKRNRDELLAKGIDPARLPPGQYSTDRFPVLHAGAVPKVESATWEFTVNGLVDKTLRLGFDGFRSLPTKTITADIHCVTKWTKFDTTWEGVSTTALLEMVGPSPDATHVVVRAEQGFTANLPLEDFAREGNLFAWRYGGEELEVDHGWPLRLVVPHLYFWKSVKWARGFDLLDHDEPGFWERNGYHMYGDPFREQRYWGD